MRNSNRKLFLSLELTSYMQAADGLKRTDSPAEHSALSEIVSPVLFFFYYNTKDTTNKNKTQPTYNITNDTLLILLTIQYFLNRQFLHYFYTLFVFFQLHTYVLSEL